MNELIEVFKTVDTDNCPICHSNKFKWHGCHGGYEIEYHLHTCSDCETTYIRKKILKHNWAEYPDDLFPNY